MTTAALGSLVVSLEANIAKFQADMGRAAYMAEKSMAQITAAAGAAKTMLLGLGGAAVVAGLAGMVRESLALASALDDLADTTGSSVEELSRLVNVAKVGGVSFSDMSAVLGKLAANLNGADEEAGKAARALQFLGVQSRDPATALQEVADALVRYSDGAAKAALARDLFGKNGPQFLAYLKDLAQETKVIGTVTSETAAEAERLEKEWKKLALTMDGWASSVAGKVAEALNEYIARFKAAREAGLGWWKSSDLATTTDEGIDRRIARVTAEIDKLNQRLEAGRERGFGAWVNDAMERLGPLRAELAILAGLKAQLEARGNSDRYDRYLRGEQGAPVGTFKPLDYSSLPDKKKLKDSADGFKEMAEAIKRAYDNAINWIKAGEEIDEIQRKMEASTAKAELAMVTAAGAAEDAIRAYEEQTDAIGKTADALAELEIKRAAEIRDIRLMTGWGDRAVELYEAQVAAIRRRASVNATEIAEKEAQSVADAFARQQESISSSLADAIMRGFEDGKGFARNFLDTLYNWFRQTILRPTIQAIVSPVAQGIAGLFGSAGNVGSIAGLLGGGVGGVGNVGSLLGGSSLLGYGGVSGLFSGAGGIFGAGAIGNSFAMSSVGQALGLSAAGLDMAGGLALTGLGTALGTAIPVIGIALALAAAFGAFDRKGGPKTGGFASNIEGLERFFTPNQQDAAMQTALDKLNSDFSATLRALGGSGTAGFALGFDEDPEGTAGSRISAQATVNGQSVFSLRDFDVGRGEGAVTAALDLAARRALLAALQASELPAEIAALFDGIVADSATAEQIDQLLAFGGAMRTITEALSGLDDIDATLARLNQGPLEALRDMGTELMDLAENFDGSVEATNALNQATATYYDAMVRTIAQIRQIKADLDAMFAGTSQSIFLAQRSPEFINSYLQTRGDELLNLVSASSDPNAINAWAREFNDILMQSWNLRTPEQQIADREGFLAAVDTFNRLVNERLDAIDADTRSNGRNVLEVASETISDAAADMKQGGADALAGGQLQLAAATTPLTIVVDYQTGEVGVRG